MKSVILSNRPVGGAYHQIRFEAPFGDAMPGQFVMIRVGDTFDPLLRRPMSIAGVDGGVCTVIYKVTGRGTRLLSGIGGGKELDVLGPFGTWFDPPLPEKKIVLVGGGIGIAPLLFWRKRNEGRTAAAFIGGASKQDILYAGAFPGAVIATEDGSLGARGLVTGPLAASGVLEGAYVLSCGPKGMLKAVDELCLQYGIKGELSLEERMGCGFGVCLGCVIETAGGRKRLCVDGPVVPSGSVVWQT